ncbi:MAG: BrnT family toxin [Methylobacterium frigidaeris]
MTGGDMRGGAANFNVLASGSERTWSDGQNYVQTAVGEGERTVWDDPKNEANILGRQIDFADLDEAFDGRFVIVAEDRRRDYGERRFDMLVEVRGVTLNIAFPPRSPESRIISARPASRRERRIFHAKQASQDGGRPDRLGGPQGDER